MSFISNAIRWLFSWIDFAIYGFIEVVFQLIIDLSNVEIFSGTTINQFATRIYIILGLVMVFKLMISFIQIIVNPDKMDDKEQGVGNVLKRVAISLALIVMVPSIFDLARQVQNYVIPIIPKVILGANISPDSSDENIQELMASTARVMSFYSYLPFFTYDNPSCNDGSILGTGSEENSPNVEIFSVATAREHILDTDNCSTDKYGYKYSYRPLMSALVGGYLLFVLVQIALEIAVRAIKLGICEFVAPIPIASYIDPKTSKQAFDNWVSTSCKTYLDLFIRLILLYFVMFVFVVLFDDATIATITKNLGGSAFRISLVLLFIIMGLLYFAKDAPKFLNDMLGIKDGGNLMGMFKGEGYKRMKESLGGLAGMGMTGASSAMANYGYAKDHNESRGRALARAIGGFVGGTRRAAVAAVNREGFQGAYHNAKAATTAISRKHIDDLKKKRDNRTRYRNDMEEYNQKVEEYNQAVADRPRIYQDRVNEYNRQVAENEARYDAELNAYNAAMQTYSNENAEYTRKMSKLAGLNARYERAEAKTKDILEQFKIARIRGDGETAAQLYQQFTAAKAAQDKIKSDIDALNSLEAPTMPTAPTRPVAPAQPEMPEMPEMPTMPIRPTDSGRGRLETMVKEFTGMPMPTSKTYAQAAGYMNDAFKAFTDLQTKLESAPTLLNKPEDVITFKNKLGEKKYGSGSFEQIYNALREAQTNGRSEAVLNGHTYKIGELQEVYNEALSDGAIKLGNKIFTGTVSGSQGDVQLRGEIKDIKMSNAIQKALDHIAKNLILSGADSAEIRAALDKVARTGDVGAFLKKAKDYGADFDYTSDYLARYESNDNNNSN